MTSHVMPAWSGILKRGVAIVNVSSGSWAEILALPPMPPAKAGVKCSAAWRPAK